MKTMRTGYGLSDGTEGSIEHSVPSYGSSRNCYEQLREAIRESLAKQNFLPFPSETGRTSPNSVSLDTICSVSEGKKVRMPNVIARLMGLEELPPDDQGPEKSWRYDQRLERQGKPRKLAHELESQEREMPPKSRRRTQDGNGCSQKPFFTIDMAMPRLYQYPDESMDPRRRELEKIIESMQLTGLFKNHVSHGKSFLRSGLVSDVASSIYGEKMKMGGGRSEEIPPIVIIKPMVMSKLHRKDTERGKMIHEQQELLENGKKQKAEALNKLGRINRTSAMLNGPVRTKREEIDKKPRKISTLMENHGRKFMVFSRPLAALKAEKLRKPSNKSSIRKEPVERCRSRSRSDIPTVSPGRELTKFSDHISKRKEKAKPVVPPKHKMASSKYKGDVVLNPRREEAPSSAAAGYPSLHQLHKQDPKDGSRKNLEGIRKTKFIGLSVQKEHKNHHGRRTIPIKVASQQKDHNTISLEASIAGKKNELKQLLLSSSSFLCAAQECFDIDITSSSCPMNYKKFDANSKKIIMDCMLEVMKCKSQKMLRQQSLIMNPYLQNQKARILLDALVEELCQDLEGLLSYQIMNEFCSKNDLFVILKRDLLCHQLDISCMWDFGWEYGVLAEESELLFSQLEIHVLGDLIKETVEALYDS